jgi:hypothetical protein
MLEMIINGIFIGLGTAVGSAIGTYIYDWKIKQYIDKVKETENKMKEFFK